MIARYDVEIEFISRWMDSDPPSSRPRRYKSRLGIFSARDDVDGVTMIVEVDDLCSKGCTRREFMKISWSLANSLVPETNRGIIRTNLSGSRVMMEAEPDKRLWISWCHVSAYGLVRRSHNTASPVVSYWDTLSCDALLGHTLLWCATATHSPVVRYWDGVRVVRYWLVGFLTTKKKRHCLRKYIPQPRGSNPQIPCYDVPCRGLFDNSAATYWIFNKYLIWLTAFRHSEWR